MAQIAGGDSAAPSPMEMVGQGDARPGGYGPSSGAGADQSEIMGQIRELAQKVDALGKQIPTLGPEIQQLRAIFKRMVVKAAQGQPGQVESAKQLPMGG